MLPFWVRHLHVGPAQQCSIAIVTNGRDEDESSYIIWMKKDEVKYLYKKESLYATDNQSITFLWIIVKIDDFIWGMSGGKKGRKWTTWSYPRTKLVIQFLLRICDATVSHTTATLSSYRYLLRMRNLLKIFINILLITVTD